MYITYNETKYPCTCFPDATMRYLGLPEDFPSPVNGEIILCADDDFVMRVDNTSDYLRQTSENGVLTLTNIPEQEIMEIENIPSQLDIIEAQVTYTAMMTDTLLEV